MTNQELAALIKKNPISVGCAVVSVGLLLSLYFRGDKKETAETTLADRTATGERLTANIKNSAQLDEDLAVLTAASKELDARALGVTQLGTNSQFFYKLEGETGVKLIDFRQGTQSATKGKAAFVPISFAVSVQGELPQLLHFLRLLESGAHYCRVQTATLTANTVSRNGVMTLTLNIELLGTP